MLAGASSFFVASVGYSLTITTQLDGSAPQTVYNQKIDQEVTPIAIDGCQYLHGTGQLTFTLGPQDPQNSVSVIIAATNDNAKFDPYNFVLNDKHSSVVVKSYIGLWCASVNVTVLNAAMKK